MTDYTKLAINDIRLYLWDRLQASKLMSATDYYSERMVTPVIPIVPSQQIPEMNNDFAGKAYLVYDTNLLPSRTDWWITYEMVSFMIISPDYDQGMAIMQLMQDLFRRYDDSATDLQASPAIPSSIFDFKYSIVHSAVSPDAMKSEGGLRVGHMNIMFCYVRNTDSNGRF